MRGLRWVLGSGWALLLIVAPAPSYAAQDRGDVDRYLDEVAAAVAEPGVFVDPAVLADGRLTQRQVDRLTVQTTGRPGPLRILVLPVAALTVDRGGVTEASLAYAPRRLVQEIYRRVDARGTYAVIVSAPSQAQGQSFYAFQWARGGPVYDIKDAAERSISCCAPEYAAMLRRFIEESDDHLRKPGGSPGGGVEEPWFPEESFGGETGVSGSDPAGLVIGGLVLGGLVAGGLALARMAGRQRSLGPGADPGTVESLRAPLAEEVEEIRQRIAALGPAIGDHHHEIETRSGAARQQLDQAHGRLATMRTTADAQAVAHALAEARFELAAVTALQDGRPVPERTSPCFVDPRHGPSVAQQAYPESGLTTPVPVCAACLATLGAGQQPQPRMIQHRGAWTHHWLAFGPAWVYLNGYWPGQPFLTQLSPGPAMVGQPGHDREPERGVWNRPDSGGGGFFGGGGGGFGGGHGHGGGGGGHGGGGGGGGGGHGGGGGGGGHGGGGGF